LKDDDKKLSFSISEFGKKLLLVEFILYLTFHAHPNKCKGTAHVWNLGALEKHFLSSHVKTVPTTKIYKYNKSNIK